MEIKSFIAERELLYSPKGKGDRRRLIVRVSAPYVIEEAAAGIKLDEGSAGCTIQFDGLDEGDVEVYGIDLLHALSLAVDVDPYLRGMQKKYDLFWPTGEPYFEDAAS
jgi:hypothetical protein